MILVTGGGFIGGAVADALGQEALTVHRSAAAERTISFDLSQVDKVEELIDALKPHSLTRIVHTAAVTPWSKDPDFSLDITMAKTLAKVCNTLKIPVLLFLSGWNVYEMKGRAPFSEQTPLEPATEYGKSKLAVEAYLKANLQYTKLISLRLSSVYGPGQQSAGLIPNLVTAALEGKSISLNSTETKRDYLYIDDFVNTLQTLLTKNISDHTILNIGSGHSLAVLEVAEMIQKLSKELYGKEIAVTFDENMHESEPIDNQLDITKAQKDGLLLQTISFSEGLRKYMLWRKG